MRQAIVCFLSQTYRNKELIISFPKSDNLTRRVATIAAMKTSSRIILLERPNDVSLGEARNQAISHSNGEYICNWDDDDWYHPDRLLVQISFLKLVGGHFYAIVLKQIILYDRSTKETYLSFSYPWEGTLMLERIAFDDFKYTHKNKGEDSTIIDHLDADRRLYHLSNSAHLYTYIYHFGNTWGYAHFKSFLRRSTPLGKMVSDWMNNAID